MAETNRNAVRTVGIVSLSRGLVGESRVKHEVEIGLKRLEEMGLAVKFMPNALKGIEYLDEHPEKRAEDLISAFSDPEIDLILCAIGGDDTYRLLPYLFDGGELEKAVTNKLFLGFSDTTVNHFMLHKLGLPTFYGQSFIADICELGTDMLPYSRRYFTELITTGSIREIRPSPVWYRVREHFGPDQIGVDLKPLENDGFELLQGAPRFGGKILGGCIDTIHDFFRCEKYPDMPAMIKKYGLFPDPEGWRGRILLLESSQEFITPRDYAETLRFLKAAGVFEKVSGVLAGKPMDGVYEDEYRGVLMSVIDDPELPVVFNVNVGHAQPRCIIPFGVDARVDAEAQLISFN